MKQALTGGAYTARSVIASAQRCVNLVQEPIPQAQGEPMPSAAYPTPGLRFLSTIGSGPIRAIRQVSTGALYVVSGSGVYSVDKSTWAGTHLGDITPGLKTPVSMTDNTKDLVIVDGTATGWHVELSTNAFAQMIQSATLAPSHTIGSEAITAGIARYTPFVATFDAAVTSVTVSLATGYHGKMKCSIYDSNGAVPGHEQFTAQERNGPNAGLNTMVFETPVKLVKGTTYWVAVISDTTAGAWNVDNTVQGYYSTTAYAVYPVNDPVATAATSVVCTIAVESDPGGMFEGGDRVDYLDTYLLFNKPNTPQFYASDSLALRFDPLWFANKSSAQDLLGTLIVSKRNIWLLGEKTTEVWNNTGKEDLPFESQPDVFIDHGIAAKYSAAEYDNGIFWLASDRQGQGLVLLGAGYQTKRISTYAIENEINGYERISDAIGFCYQIGGHAFYVLTFPHADKTWSYDITTGLWHEWIWLDANGAEHRHRANCCWPVDGKPIVGDWQSGNLYALDSHVYTDDGKPIKRLRAYPHLLNDGKRVFYRQFLCDFDAGNAPPLPALRTATVEIITWPPEIAQTSGLAVGAVLGVVPDWDRGLVYFIGQTGFAKYSTALTTQTAALATTTVPTQILWGADADPLTGDLITQGGPDAMNGQPIYKRDPTTFAVLGTFGVSTSFPSYPTSVWAGQQIVCVVCNGVSFGFLKYSEFSGVVSGFRVDTMQHSGFSQAIVSGSTDNRGAIIAGKSGGPTASVFLSWDATTTIQPGVPLYRIDVTAAATAYNPASWPTPNPGITWTTVTTVPVASVEPAWTGFTVYSLGYDQADGNVLMLCGTQNTAQGYRLIKIHHQTGAVMWNLTMGTVSADLTRSNIDGSLWLFRNPGAGAGLTDSYQIDTLAGTMTTQPISGVFASSGASATKYDSTTQIMLFGGTFAVGAGVRPIPVTGTSPFATGWGNMGGKTSNTVIIGGTSVTSTSQISLRWSNDRGHTWGSPILQDIGEIGQYLSSLQWQRCGYARDRVWEISWSVAMPAALQGAWLDFTSGQS